MHRAWSMTWAHANSGPKGQQRGLRRHTSPGSKGSSQKLSQSTCGRGDSGEQGGRGSSATDTHSTAPRCRPLCARPFAALPATQADHPCTHARWPRLAQGTGFTISQVRGAGAWRPSRAARTQAQPRSAGIQGARAAGQARDPRSGASPQVRCAACCTHPVRALLIRHGGAQHELVRADRARQRVAHHREHKVVAPHGLDGGLGGVGNRGGRVAVPGLQAAACAAQGWDAGVDRSTWGLLCTLGPTLGPTRWVPHVGSRAIPDIQAACLPASQRPAAMLPGWRPPPAASSQRQLGACTQQPSAVQRLTGGPAL